MVNSLPKKTFIYLGLTLSISFLLILIYAVNYTKQSKTPEVFNQAKVGNRFDIQKISPDLTANTKNADLEKDLQTIDQDLETTRLQLNSLLNQVASLENIDEFKNKLNSFQRISPLDKGNLFNKFIGEGRATTKELSQKYQSLMLIYLFSSLIDRQAALSDKLLPRYEAVPPEAGQSKTVKSMYDETRINLNKMRNLNSESYFLIISSKDPTLIKQNLFQIQELADSNEENMSAVIPLILPFELP